MLAVFLRRTSRRVNSLRKKIKYDSVERNTTRIDFTPNVVNINGVVHSQFLATISTGGAAKWVRSPPTEIDTNSKPSVAYFSLLDGECMKNFCNNNRHIIVICFNLLGTYRQIKAHIKRKRK